jgi:hypothetical protein
VRPALLVFGFASAFLVVVLLVNLASVLLARAAQREHEFAVSRALGANNVALVRATLFEGGLLGCIGGSIGALAAVWGTRALLALAPLDVPRRDAVAVDWGIGAVMVRIGTALGLLAAVAPATWAARTSLASLLAMSAVRGAGGHGRMRRGMVVAQVALSLVLLSTGGLVVRSFQRLLVANPGFRPDGLLTVPSVPAALQCLEDRFPLESPAAKFVQLLSQLAQVATGSVRRQVRLSGPVAARRCSPRVTGGGGSGTGCDGAHLRVQAIDSGTLEASIPIRISGGAVSRMRGVAGLRLSFALVARVTTVRSVHSDADRPEVGRPQRPC